MNFTTKIVQWYNGNKRDLPWRKTKNPYVIWISEVILQQTRINQGLAYFERFIENFPTVFDLASADEERVLKLWQGLGYYSRARNLHHTAKAIVNERQGKFPDSYDEIISMKGIGQYTAAAVLSIAFNKPYPVVDGNVARVLSRVFGMKSEIDTQAGAKALLGKAEKLIDKNDPATFNQAIMEFGALYCIPLNPDCHFCIFKEDCYAHQHHMVNQLPIKRKPKPLRKRYFHYFVFRNDHSGFYFLNKRTGDDIWKHLYDFPLIETEKPVSGSAIEQLFAEKFGSKVSLKNSEMIEFKHVLTHQLITARFYQIRLSDLPNPARLAANLTDRYQSVLEEEISQYPVSRIVEKYFQSHIEKK